MSATQPQALPLNERVLVVYNQSVPESLEVADYYMMRRAIPPANKCAVNSAQTTYIPDWNVFNSIIKTPIRNCLNAVGPDNVLYIVFSYQTPYKVGAPARSIDQQVADIWDEYAAGTEKGGAHDYYAAAQSEGNFYQPFIPLALHRQQPASKRIYSVWRLDAQSAALARGLVDKALLAEAGGLVGRGCFDVRQNMTAAPDYRAGAGDWDIHRGAELARAAGFQVTEDNNEAEFGTAPAPARCDDAALYAGWYSLNHYNDAFSWKPGAIGFHTDSLSAYDLRGGTNWSANALAKGITVTSGAIEEPFLDGVAHADGVFRNLFEGANLGDALLRNTQWLKWMIVNVGDPLYRPFAGGRAPFNAPDVAEASLFMSPIEVGGGGPSTATLRLAAPAPPGGLQVSLASSNASAATPPSSVTVPEGSRSVIFNINTAPVTSELYSKITATYPGGSLSATLIVDTNRAPSVSLTAPASGATFRAPATIAVSANASDRDGRVARVDFYAGAVLIGTDTTSPYGVTWNNAPEGSHTLKAVATDSAGAQTTSDPVNITITPAETPAPRISVGAATVTEGNTGTVNATFNVKLSAASAQTVTVKYQTANGTAAASADYTAQPLTTLTFTPGQTSRPVTVAVRGDLLDEVNETFKLVLSAPTNATLGAGQAIATIVDDDAPPSLSVNNVTLTELNSGTNYAVFTLRLSAASGRTVAVKYQTADGTATSPADYTAKALTTLSFTAGQTGRTVAVAVKGDLLDEPDETFKLILSAPTNATLAAGQGTATIKDNDGP